jgi:hypothetical protein
MSARSRAWFRLSVRDFRVWRSWRSSASDKKSGTGRTTFGARWLSSSRDTGRPAQRKNCFRMTNRRWVVAFAVHLGRCCGFWSDHWSDQPSDQWSDGWSENPQSQQISKLIRQILDPDVCRTGQWKVSNCLDDIVEYGPTSSRTSSRTNSPTTGPTTKPLTTHTLSPTLYARRTK